MTNNDILRRVRYIFDFDDAQMITIFGHADLVVKRSEVSDWLKADDDPEIRKMEDAVLATFLNGLIIEKRGRREGPQPVPEKRLTNNLIFTKLKIAMNLKAGEVLEILELAKFSLGKHELSAFFRKPGHKHYRECKDQVLRNFLKGAQLRHRSAWGAAE